MFAVELKDLERGQRFVLTNFGGERLNRYGRVLNVYDNGLIEYIRQSDWHEYWQRSDSFRKGFATFKVKLKHLNAWGMKMMLVDMIQKVE